MQEGGLFIRPVIGTVTTANIIEVPIQMHKLFGRSRMALEALNRNWGIPQKQRNKRFFIYTIFLDTIYYFLYTHSKQLKKEIKKTNL